MEISMFGQFCIIIFILIISDLFIIPGRFGILLYNKVAVIV